MEGLGVIGPSRSVIKTCDDSPCSRCRRLRARISSPCIGWTLGERLGVDRAGLTLAPTGTACRLFAPTVRYDWSVTLGAFFDCTALFALQTPQGAYLVTLHR